MVHTTNVAMGYLSFHRFDVLERYDMRNHGSKANYLSHVHVLNTVVFPDHVISKEDKLLTVTPPIDGESP